MLDALRAVQATLDAADAERAALDASVAARQHIVTRSLVELLLPALEAPFLDALAVALRLPTLGAAAVLGPLEQERLTLAAQLAESQAAVARDGVDVEPVEKELEEIAGYCAAVKSGVDRRLGDAEFRRLLEDTQGEAWWLFSFYRRMANAERVVQRHGAPSGMNTLRELLDYHHKQVEALRQLTEERSELARRRALMRSRGQRERDLKAALEALGPAQLERVRAFVAEMLPRQDLHEALRAFPARVHPELVRLHGYAAMRRYLAAMGPSLLGPIRVEADALLRRLSGLADSGMADVVYSRQDRAAQLGARVDHALALMRQVAAFEAWERFEPGWPLWWDWFVDGSDGGTFLEEVAVFRAQHRGLTLQEHLARPAAQQHVRADPAHHAQREEVAAPVGTYLGDPDDDDAGGPGPR
jgi:hypothetical protein